MPITPKIGTYPNVPFEEYIKWEAASNTILGIIDNKSPAHAKSFMDNPPEPSEAFVFGKALHKFNLEVMSFDETCVVAPDVDKRTKNGKVKWQEFLDKNNDKLVMTQEQYEKCKSMAEAIENHSNAKKFIWGGSPEICIVWLDTKTGVLCKARLDYVHNEGVIADLKSTRDASLSYFARAIYNYGYHRQAAFYSDGWYALTKDMPEFVFVPVEKEEPFGVATYLAGEDVITAGRQSYERALKIYAECLQSGDWPGYSNEIEMIHLPTWALMREGISEYEIKL